MYCKQCSFPIPEQGKFCGKCGASQDDDMQREQPQIKEATKKVDTKNPSVKIKGKLAFCPSFLNAYFKEPRTDYIFQNDFETYHDSYVSQVKKPSFFIGEFSKCSRGDKAKFNIWALLLLIPYAIYMGVWKEMVRVLYHPTLLYIVAAAVGTMLVSLLSTIGVILGLIAFGIALGSCIWGTIRQIKFSRDFNLIYMHHIDEKISEKRL